MVYFGSVLSCLVLFGVVLVWLGLVVLFVSYRAVSCLVLSCLISRLVLIPLSSFVSHLVLVLPAFMVTTEKRITEVCLVHVL